MMKTWAGACRLDWSSRFRLTHNQINSWVWTCRVSMYIVKREREGYTFDHSYVVWFFSFMYSYVCSLFGFHYVNVGGCVQRRIIHHDPGSHTIKLVHSHEHVVWHVDSNVSAKDASFIIFRHTRYSYFIINMWAGVNSPRLVVTIMLIRNREYVIWPHIGQTWTQNIHILSLMNCLLSFLLYSFVWSLFSFINDNGGGYTQRRIDHNDLVSCTIELTRDYEYVVHPCIKLNIGAKMCIISFMNLCMYSFFISKYTGFSRNVYMLFVCQQDRN